MNSEIKVGLLFLVYENDLRQPQIWREFLAEAAGNVRIFTHQKHSTSHESILCGTEIREWHHTMWGGIGLVYAMFALLRAAIDDKSLTHFCFASESCVPIKPWSRIREILIDDPRSRILCSSWQEMRKVHRVRRNRTLIAKQFWRHHPQWVTLDRATAIFLLNHKATLEEMQYVHCSDEHVIGTILSIHGYDQDRINNASATWTLWNGGSHPETIDSVNLDVEQKLRSFEGFFARKFTRDSNVGNLKLHLS